MGGLEHDVTDRPLSMAALKRTLVRASWAWSLKFLNMSVEKPSSLSAKAVTMFPDSKILRTLSTWAIRPSGSSPVTSAITDFR